MNLASPIVGVGLTARATRTASLTLSPGAFRLFGGLLDGIAGLTVRPALHGQPQPGDWQLLSGGAVFTGLACVAAAWQRPPYCLSLQLVQAAAGGRSVALGEAVLGTRSGLRALSRRTRLATAELVRAALTFPDGGRGELSGDCSAELAARSLAAHLALGTGRYLVHRLQEKLTVERWGIGFVQAPLTAALADLAAPVTWVRAGALGDLADPFCLPGTGRVLCEQLPHKADGVGRVLSLDITPEGRIASAQHLHVTRRHHSYPFAACFEGRTLLLPEAPARGATILYALDAPGAPHPVCAVAPGLRMADPTLFQHAGRHWIAYTDLDLGEHDNLCLLWAETLSGPWIAHRRNPVKVDIRSARPGGMPFRVGGQLYRPAQDCAAGYGAAVVINRLDVLTPDDFAEVAVNRLAPDPHGPYPHGLHTVSGDERRLLLDGKRFVVRPGALIRKAVHRFQHLGDAEARWRYLAQRWRQRPLLRSRR